MIINKKKIAWNRYRRRKTTLRYENYCRIRNEATTALREARSTRRKFPMKQKRIPKQCMGI